MFEGIQDVVRVANGSLYWLSLAITTVLGLFRGSFTSLSSSRLVEDSVSDALISLKKLSFHEFMTTRSILESNELCSLSINMSTIIITILNCFTRSLKLPNVDASCWTCIFLEERCKLIKFVSQVNSCIRVQSSVELGNLVFPLLLNLLLFSCFLLLLLKQL